MTTVLSSMPACPWGCKSPDWQKKNLWENAHLVIEGIKTWNVCCWQIIDGARKKLRACVWTLPHGCNCIELRKSKLKKKSSAQLLMREMFILHQKYCRVQQVTEISRTQGLTLRNTYLCLLEELLISPTAREACCHSCNIRVRHERSCGFIIIPCTKEYFLQYRVNPPPPNLYWPETVQYLCRFFSARSMGSKENLQGISAPPRQATANIPFLVLLQEKGSTENVWSLKNILQTIFVGVKQWLSLQ